VTTEIDNIVISFPSLPFTENQIAELWKKHDCEYLTEGENVLLKEVLLEDEKISFIFLYDENFDVMRNYVPIAVRLCNDVRN